MKYILMLLLLVSVSSFAKEASRFLAPRYHQQTYVEHLFAKARRDQARDLYDPTKFIIVPYQIPPCAKEK